MNKTTDTTLTISADYRQFIEELKARVLSHNPILAQLVPELLGPVAWGHHVELLKKVKAPAARLWYLLATARFGWSRNVAINQIKASVYERAVTEKKTHNFDLALPDCLPLWGLLWPLF